MPTYEYRCNACEHRLDTFQSITAKALKKCPECGKLKLERLISGGGAIIFKGGGFYETDYRSESYKQGAEAEKKAAETKSESKSDGKTETKTESKADKKTDSKTDKKPAAKTDSKPKAASKK
ncbi:MAG: zinc ribbon domain-containing protein [Planctomycetota bacterium]